MSLDLQLILASNSPRRRQLLASAGYVFQVHAPHESVEPEISETQSPMELVSQSAFVKAENVAQRFEFGLILAADTVAECGGRILGKPRDRQHAKEMLLLMSSQRHRVLTGVTLWHRPTNKYETFVEQTILKMDELSEAAVESYLDTNQWIGKAGGFGYQDNIGWIHIVEGSESNVVGLPMEALKVRMEQFPKSI